METAVQFDEPLMHQCIRHQHEHPLGAAGEVQTMQDQTGLDGFAQTHLIRQQHARHETPGDLTGDVHLMRQQIHASAHESAHWRLTDLRAAPERLDTQVVSAEIIGLCSHETVFRLAEADRVG